MFNFLKKQQPETTSIEQRIFNDVYSAEGMILEEAKRVLSNPPTFSKEKEARLEELTKLGFTQFDEAVKLRKEKESAKQHNDLRAAINYYNKVYPFNRFISQDSVQVIIKKYGLLLAKAGNYIAEIPDEKQKEIISFRVMRKDTREPDELRTGTWGLITIPMLDLSYGWLDRNYCMLSEEEQAKIKRDKKAKEKAEGREKIPGKDLLIVAPSHKLDMVGGRIKAGILIKDPIVLQPVVMGYLIVSSWGLEASDPIVVNPINN